MLTLKPEYKKHTNWDKKQDRKNLAVINPGPSRTP